MAFGPAIRTSVTGALVLVVSMLAILLVVGISTGIGDLPIPLSTTFFAVTNRLGWSGVELNRIHETVIWDYRLSRALVAAFCGAGLALSGAIMQSLLRNPLAEPYVLGISAGASTGAVAVVILGLGAGALSLSAGAFAGAFLAFFFVALLSNGTRGGADRTILAGVAASQLFNAATSYIVTTSGNAQQARDVMFWLLGSFGGVRWPEFALVAVVIGLGLLICLFYARVLDAFAFGDEAAAALGVNVGRARIVLFAMTAMMTATIVSMVGSIGFVGLVVPHAARFLVGPWSRSRFFRSAW
jgi:iron complex transport system permease protein